MKPIFNIRGEGSFAFIMGIISGYPVGAKIVANLIQITRKINTEFRAFYAKICYICLQLFFF